MIWATHLGAVREGEDDLSWGLFGHASAFVSFCYLQKKEC